MIFEQVTETAEYKIGYHLGQIDASLKKYSDNQTLICPECKKETANAQNCELCKKEICPF